MTTSLSANWHYRTSKWNEYSERRFVIYTNWVNALIQYFVSINEIEYMKSRSTPFFGIVLYTEISFIQRRTRICKRDLVFFVAQYYISRSRLHKRHKRDLVQFGALYYIPISRFYKWNLLYVNQISSILCYRNIYWFRVYINEVSYM